ncbi:3-oxoacyl-reductase [Syncephalis fuscata]|nr:3-oxoacyl-reductase [Syncephalis fuscata]
MTIPTAVITGGSRGIGLACGQLLAQSGYRLVLAGRNKDHLNDSLDSLATLSTNKIFGLIDCNNDNISKIKSEAASIGHVAAICDVRSDEQVEQLCKSVAAMGSVDVVINSAGIVVNGLCSRLSIKEVQSMLDVNLLGTIRVCKAFAPIMMRQKKGCIINLASTVGEQGSTGQSGYAASKAGIVGLTKALAKELASRKIRVNAISPGFIKTDMTKGDVLLKDIPLGRFGIPDDVAKAALYLTQADYVTGQVILYSI